MNGAAEVIRSALVPTPEYTDGNKELQREHVT